MVWTGTGPPAGSIKGRLMVRVLSPRILALSDLAFCCWLEQRLRQL